MVFGFWFLFTILSPCGGHPFTGKDLGSCHSTLCFHRDSKVSIDSNDSLRNNTIINKLGNKHNNLPSYTTTSSSTLEQVLQATESHSQAPKLKEQGAVIQAVHTEHDAPSIWPMHFMALQALKKAEKYKKNVHSLFRCMSSTN